MINNSAFILTALSNIDNSIKYSKVQLLTKNKLYSLYGNNQTQLLNDNISIFIDGYIIPRNEIFGSFCNLDNHALILELHKKYGTDFIKYIKGIFCIIIINNQDIKIFTDQFGIYKLFYSKQDNSYIFSNQLDLLFELGVEKIVDTTSLAIKSILNQVDQGHSIYKNIFTVTPASQITLSDNKIKFSEYWDREKLLDFSSHKSKVTIENLAMLIQTNFNNFIQYTKVKNHVITLTGGKDSRTGLAALLSLGVPTIGFTYGNPSSIDAVYAQSLAKSASIPYFTFSPPESNQYFKKTAEEILNYENPDISLHRGHRLYAFKELAQQLNDETAYYAGYMAGEFLIGLYYDDLVFRKYLTDFWETSGEGSLETIFSQYHHVLNSIDTNEVQQRLSKLKTFCKSTPSKIRQFHGIFEIGIPHHCQDIFLSQHFFKYPYPFFIDIDFLETLFRSNYNLLFANNKTKNPFKRYKLFELNLKIQHLLAPQMDKIPFGKRGYYNTYEFLKGRTYWVILKTFRYFFNNKKYPPSYSYSQTFRDFILNELIEIQKDKENNLPHLFNIKKAIEELQKIKGNTSEKEMHRFSNIVMLNQKLNHSIRTTTI